MLPDRLLILLVTLAHASCAHTPSAPVPAPSPPFSPSPPTSALPAASPAASVFRAPFTLTLHVDEERYYEQEFDAVPYVHEGVVYLFKGDHFGVKLDAQGGAIYEPDLAKSDLEFEFSQGTISEQPAMMVLVVTSHMDRTVSMSALMTIPEKEEISKTTILPVHAGLKSYESWPHPIVQLVVKDFRVEP